MPMPFQKKIYFYEDRIFKCKNVSTYYIHGNLIYYGAQSLEDFLLFCQSRRNKTHLKIDSLSEKIQFIYIFFKFKIIFFA